MVAYSFKSRFVWPIRARTKTGTIRAKRRRQVRPGELMQLYCGMRTSGCFKIIPDQVCKRVNEIEIMPAPVGDGWVRSNGVLIHEAGALDAFAVCDGFVRWADMVEFWLAQHPDDTGNAFTGDHILWA